MDFSRAMRTLTNDPQWSMKVLIGGLFVLLSFLIVPALFVAGYTLEAMRQAANGEDRLPTWDDLGGHLVRGGLAVAIQLVYAIPALILGCCIGAAASAASGTQNPDAANALATCLSCLSIPLSIAAAYLGPAALLRFVQTGDLGAAFNVGAVVQFIRDHLGPYTLAFLISAALGLATLLISPFLCFLPLPWLAFVASLLGYLLYGQVAQVAGREAAFAPTSGF